MSENPGILRRLFGAAWRGLTRIRLVVSNLLFLLVVVVLIALLTGGPGTPLPDKAALLLNPVGTVVEQKSLVDPLAMLLNEPMPEEREVLLADMIDAILWAKDDPAITSLVLELDQLSAIGISKTGELAEAIAEFRDSGKPVVAWGDSFTQTQYLLAAQADTVTIHPMGNVLLEGFANYQWYFAEALEKLSVNVHVFKAGEHKSIAEPLLRNDMSAGEKAVSQRWLDALWAQYTEQVEQRRQLPAGAVNAYVNNFAETVAGNNGDLAVSAEQAGLVDKVLGRSAANAWLASVVGATDEYGDYQAVGFEHYVTHARPPLANFTGKPQVATIAARGMIQDGDQPAGSIGGDSLALLLHDAIDDPGIAAIVLRIDSGGGSAFASEIVRQKVLEARQRGKPVVVSMGSVAASGGYWIAAAANEIWATPATLTGSIGVFGAIPTFEGLLQRAGVHTDGVATTDVAGAFRTDRALQPAVSATFQAAIDSTYERFVGLVSEGREMPREDVYKLATGSVFAGTDALELGLVDQLGSRRAAVKAAAKLAGLQPDEYISITYEDAPDPGQLLLQQLMGSARATLGSPGSGWPQSLTAWQARLQAGLQILQSLDDPNSVYAHCMVCLAP
ncbi:MAG: signal peptide peptidase SppA [Halieaceae bacterium]